jgi:serpin B
LQDLDFGQPDAACRAINLWVAQQTAQQIRDLVSPSMIDAKSTRLMLTNAAYFKGEWQSQFDPSNTNAGEFFTGDRHFFTPTMYQRGGFRVRETEKLLVLEMPYHNKVLSMLVLLPLGETGALEELEASLSAESIRQWLRVGKTQDTEVFLPKFKIETTCDLPAVLGELGMAQTFRAGAADFSGMNDGKEPLCLNAVVHKAYVEVDEKGTKAAAATGIGTFGGPPPPKFIFRADHPFVFLILDKRTNCILFLGRVTNPEKCAATLRGVKHGPRPSSGPGGMM